MMRGAVTFVLLTVACAALIASVRATDARADGYKYALQYFTNNPEYWGERGYFVTMNPSLSDVNHQHSLSNLYIATEPEFWLPDAAFPWVEMGYYKGHSQNAGYCGSTPRVFVGTSDDGTWENYVEFDYNTLGIGSVHKFGISRTDHDPSTGDTEWTFYLDGDMTKTCWRSRPDQGHPSAGGEIWRSGTDYSWPEMLTHGRSNGSGISNRLCIKTSGGTWSEWDTTYSSRWDFWQESGTTFTQLTPKYSSFNCTD
jgi:hypothetical protein